LGGVIEKRGRGRSRGGEGEGGRRRRTPSGTSERTYAFRCGLKACVSQARWVLLRFQDKRWKGLRVRGKAKGTGGRQAAQF
jgi:hypothetical protein